MATNKKSFLLYCDLIHTLDKLPDDKAGQLLKHILMYVNDQDPTTDDLILQIAFEPIKQQLKRDLVKYDNFINKQSENGKLGGRPKTQTNPENPSLILDNPNKPKKADSDTVTDTDKVKDKENIHFDLFYDLYAKKTDGLKAKIKWDKLDYETQTKIMEIVPDYVKSTPDKKYRKSPLVYLNNQSWLDEIIGAKTEKQQNKPDTREVMSRYDNYEDYVYGATKHGIRIMSKEEYSRESAKLNQNPYKYLQDLKPKEEYKEVILPF